MIGRLGFAVAALGLFACGLSCRGAQSREPSVEDDGLRMLGMPEEVLDERRALVGAVREEAAAGEAWWAGSYRKPGRESASLYVGPESGIYFEAFTDLGFVEFSWGTVRVAGDALVLEPERHLGSSRRTPARVFPVRCGERKLLVRDEDWARFCERFGRRHESWPEVGSSRALSYFQPAGELARILDRTPEEERRALEEGEPLIECDPMTLDGGTLASAIEDLRR